MQNELAEMSELFIFCDGPKADATKQDQERINKVRDLVKKKNWCKKVTIRASHVNKGLADCYCCRCYPNSQSHLVESLF